MYKFESYKIAKVAIGVIPFMGIGGGSHSLDL